MPTPCRIEAIFILMNSKEFQTNANAYFRELVRDDTIECDFRYKTILSLEKTGADLMKKDIDRQFRDKEFVTHFYKYLEPVISKLFPKIKPNVDNRKFWDNVLYRLSYDDIHDIYKKKFPYKPVGRDFFIHNGQLAFLFHKPNQTYYRILSGQYLLQKCELNEVKRCQVEKQLLEFAQDEELDYNRRADAADVLLSLGSPNMQQNARNIIMELGKIDGEIRTVFDNAQNVHTEEVEESVTEALEFLSAIPVYQVKGKPIDFDYVNTKVEDMLKEERELLMVSGDGKEMCDHCSSPIDEKVEADDEKVEADDEKVEADDEKVEADEGGKRFCSNKCLRFYFRDEKIRLAMNRIFMDRALYSKFNSSLLNILLKVYTYVVSSEQEHVRQQMYKRLFEELEEMSGTCSSGFATRLINVISGFGQFNIRISYEDQIVANFTGRLNTEARKISEENSIFRSTRLHDMVEIWLSHPERQKMVEQIEKILNPSGKFEKRPNRSDVVVEFLRENRNDKIEKCVEDFAEAVLNEMTVPSSSYASRRNFSLFFRTYVSIIREELAAEFKNLVDSTQFDFAFRRAIMNYDTGF
jgi:hypothetical protein